MELRSQLTCPTASRHRRRSFRPIANLRHASNVLARSPETRCCSVARPAKWNPTALRRLVCFKREDLMPSHRPFRRLAAVMALALFGACTPSAPSGSSTPTVSTRAASPVAVSPTPAGSSYDVPRTLRRPLRMPPMPSHGRCPATPSRQVQPAFGDAAGPGPVYPVYGGSSVMFFPQRDQPPGGFYRAKVLWVTDPLRYQGPVLIRAARLDGDDPGCGARLPQR